MVFMSPLKSTGQNKGTSVWHAPSSAMVAAALRHLFSYMRGEDVDAESGLSHVAHAMCCCMFLLGLEKRTDLDDRWKDAE